MSIIPDSQIKAEMRAGRLIKNGDVSRVGPACYELRMGKVYYDLTESDKRIEAPPNNTILIKPGHRVVLITQEALDVPPNMLARIASKGSFFTVGLSPVSTYADPGFSGNIGIVTQNISDKYIVLPVGEPIAKVDFAMLSGAVDRPYQGQHGYHISVWPIRHELQKSYGEVRHDKRVSSEEEESYKILPAAVVNVIRRMQKRQRMVDIAIVAAVFVNACALALVSTKVMETFEAILVNLLSSAIVGCMAWFGRAKE